MERFLRRDDAVYSVSSPNYLPWRSSQIRSDLSLWFILVPNTSAVVLTIRLVRNVASAGIYLRARTYSVLDDSSLFGTNSNTDRNTISNSEDVGSWDRNRAYPHSQHRTFGAFAWGVESSDDRFDRRSVRVTLPSVEKRGLARADG